MFLRPHQRHKDGEDHAYWSLVETVRTVDGPRQRTLCYLGELNSSAQDRWLRTVEVFNEQGEAQQLKLFPSHVEPPPDDPQVRTGEGRRNCSWEFNCFRGFPAALPKSPLTSMPACALSTLNGRKWTDGLT